jgi:hypothetical protein
MQMEQGKNADQAVVVWENCAGAANGAGGDKQQANVVTFRPGAKVSAEEGEPAVVSRSMPGRSGEAGTVIYVGSGFWARSAGSGSASASPRMAA